jgi:hypothetical protein
LRLQSFTRDYLKRLTQGDPAVREHFAAYFHERIYLKYRWHISCAELEEIQRETLSRALDAVGRGDVNPERFDAFVLSISCKVGREFARQRLMQDPDAPVILEQRRRKMKAIMNGLTAQTVENLQALFGKSK